MINIFLLSLNPLLTPRILLAILVHIPYSASRDVVVNAINSKSMLGKQPISYLLMTDEMVQEFGVDKMKWYIHKKLFRSFDTPNEVSEYMDLEADELKDTLEDYVLALTDGKDIFGKEIFPAYKSLLDIACELEDGSKKPSSQKLYVANVTPAIHYCMGGITSNSAAEVLSQQQGSGVWGSSDNAVDYEPVTVGAGASSLVNPSSTEMWWSDRRGVNRKFDPLYQPIMRPISGLFAAGEICGGVHGANRLAGNSLLEGVLWKNCCKEGEYGNLH